MSTNKTQNYNLHSWLPADEFRLTEINENFAAVDTALGTKADKAALSALGKLVVGSWTGAYTEKPVIDLGKPIRALLLENHCGWRGSFGDARFHGGLILANKTFLNSMVTISGTQFQINSMSDYNKTWTFYYLAWVEE